LSGLVIKIVALLCEASLWWLNSQFKPS